VLLADLLDWHRREDKPAWWRYFYLRGLSCSELTGEPDALGELTGGEIVISRLCGGWISAFEALGDPYLDDGLAGDSQAPCLTVERFDHPHREVHVHPALFQSRPLGRRQVESGRDILSAIERLVELLSLHRSPPTSTV